MNFRCSKGLSASSGLVEEAIANALVNAEVPLFQAAVNAYYQGKDLPLKAMPRTLPPSLQPPKGAGNQFGALVDLATNKKLTEALFPKTKAPLPEIPGTTATLGGVMGGMDVASPEVTPGSEGG